MKRTLYLECYSGISGDMTVGALLDLGADQRAVDEAVDSIRPFVPGFDIAVTRVQKAGIDACDFNVILDRVHENHDHDMAYLHEHAHFHETHGEELCHGHGYEAYGEGSDRHESCIHDHAEHEEDCHHG